jgi:oligosaccharide repeat unit polymerase
VLGFPARRERHRTLRAEPARAQIKGFRKTVKTHRQTIRNAVLFAAFALAGIGVSCLAIVPSGRVLQMAAAVVLLLVIAGAVFADALVGRFHLANLKYFILLAFALFLGAGMIVDATRFDFAVLPAGILLSYGALLCFLFGFTLFGPDRNAKRRRAGPSFPLTSDQLLAVTLLFFALGFLFVFLEWRLYDQIQTYGGKFAAGGAPPQKVMPYVQTFTQLMMPAVILAFIQLRRGASLFRRVLLLLFLAAAVAWYLVWGARGNFLWLAVAFVLIWAELRDERGSKHVGWKPALVLALSISAILALGVVRTTWDVRRAERAGLGGVWDQAKNSLDTYHQLTRTLDYFPSRGRFLHGYSFYGVIANPVPRALWPGKPVGVGKLASILYDGNPDNSIGLSLPGELYANFGYAGSLFGMFLFGVLAARIYGWYLSQRGDPVALVVYLMALVCMMTEVRGDILDATAPLLYTLLPAVLCFGLLAAANKHAARNRAAAENRSVPRGSDSLFPSAPQNLTGSV